ncbi:MAG: hypothetical protein ACRDQB_06895 [Thermocrispum sp.]
MLEAKETLVGKHTARRTLAALGVAGLLAGASFLLVGTSSATAASATSKCSGTVTGKMGETITLKSAAVQDFVVDSVRGGFDFPLLPITKSNKTKLNELFEADKFEPIKLTTVPRAASGVLSDEKIAAAVVRKIESNDDGKQILSEHDNRNAVLKAVEANCSNLTVKASNYVAAPAPGGKPSQDTTQPGAQPGAGSGSGTGSPGGVQRGENGPYNLGALPLDYGTGDARAPRRDYGGVPFTLPGYGTGDVRAANPYNSAPGIEQEFGVLGDGGTRDPEVNNAGNAEAIQAAGPQDQAIQLPMLLAVVSLACVAAALVRTWVLRRI